MINGALIRWKTPPSFNGVSSVGRSRNKVPVDRDDGMNRSPALSSRSESDSCLNANRYYCAIAVAITRQRSVNT